MGQLQLPPHLQALRGENSLAKQLATQFATTSLPPHISIEGNKFTMVDAAGNEKPCATHDPKLGVYFDCVVFDLSDHITRLYYGDQAYTKGQGSVPLCFSDNGVAPSYKASVPQAKSCMPDPPGVNGCKWSVWGSKISALTGKKIPACASGIKLAVLPVELFYDEAGNVESMGQVEGVPLMMLRVPPASINNATDYGKSLNDQGAELPMVITRVFFEGQGILKFTAVQWVDEELFPIVKQAIDGKAGDTLVGRDDRPYTGMIAGPQQAAPQVSAPAPIPTPAQLQAPPAPTSAPPEAPQPRGRGRPRKVQAEPPMGAPPAQPSFIQPAASSPMPAQQTPPAGNGGVQMGIAANAPSPTAALNQALNNAFNLKT